MQMLFNGQLLDFSVDLNLCGAIPPCVSVVHFLFKLSSYRSRMRRTFEFSTVSRFLKELTSSRDKKKNVSV